MSRHALDEIDEDDVVGSLNHAIVQGNLIYLLKQAGDYTVCPELSLDVSQLDMQAFDLGTLRELKPDIALYSKRGLHRPNDILRMTEMPLLAVEVLSPRQGSYTLLEKFKAYFAAGVRSCWLVEPVLSTVSVYADMQQQTVFTLHKDTQLEDTILGLKLPLSDVFA